jgi:serine/threonine protein kinase
MAFLPDRDGMKLTHRNEITLYKSGDLIGGKYEIRDVLGEGGCGVVYLALDRETKRLCALKTFRDDLLTSATAREAFKNETRVWVNLENHPFILAARWVVEFSGRLFVEMDYVAPDSKGRINLGHYLTGHPLDTNQVLKWSIQFCSGMEHANSHGIECHRDIKPGNILIGNDRALKITDFGLAAAAEAAWRQRNGHGEIILYVGKKSDLGLSLIRSLDNKFCGTPGYIPPEVLRGEAWDKRSDMYSFGLVMWQMCTGSTTPPFIVLWKGNLEEFLRENYQQQIRGRLPRFNSPLKSVVVRCLSPKRSERYSDFHQLRRVLELMWRKTVGSDFVQPIVEERGVNFWNRKGQSLSSLGKDEQAIMCYDKALAIDPSNVVVLNNKGIALRNLGRFAEAIECLDIALAIDPENETFWNTKGTVLDSLRRYDEAIECYNKAAAINKKYANPWYNKGRCFFSLKRYKEATACFDGALAINPKDTDVWHSKGVALAKLGRQEDAVECYDKALAIDPLSAGVWFDRAVAWEVICMFGTTPLAMEYRQEAITSYRKFLALASPDKLESIAKARQRIQVLESK